jgi:hypothetical protein
MTTISTQDPLALAVVAAIHTGRVEDLGRLLQDHPGLATTRLGDEEPGGMSRSLLHIATDWPGHFPDVGPVIAVLVAAGADVNARFRGPHRETPLHWAASSDDVEALEALLDAGADLEADGGVIAGSTALRDATAFAQWDAARALVSRGAHASPFDLAALGLTEELIAALDAADGVTGGGIMGGGVDHAFWAACHGGQLGTAQALLARGADPDWLPPWEQLTPLDAAARSQAHAVVRWLHASGAHTSDELRAAGRGDQSH